MPRSSCAESRLEAGHQSRILFGCRYEGGELGLGSTPVFVTSSTKELHVVCDNLAHAALLAFPILEGAVPRPALGVEWLARIPFFSGAVVLVFIPLPDAIRRSRRSQSPFSRVKAQSSLTRILVRGRTCRLMRWGFSLGPMWD